MNRLNHLLFSPTKPNSPDYWREVFEILIGLTNPFEILQNQPLIRQLVTSKLSLIGSWPTRERYYAYVAFLAGYGTVQSLNSFQAGKRVILGFRIETSTKANQGKGIYDDWFVVLDPKMSLYSGIIDEFPGNTEPSYRYDAKNTATTKHLGKDVDGDGVIDLGRIPEGTYLFRKSHSAKYGNILAPVSKIRLERDSNHDGWFDASDKVKPKLSANLYATDTFFHKGSNNATGSAGCQTLKPEAFESFWASLGSQSEFFYVLIRP